MTFLELASYIHINSNLRQRILPFYNNDCHNITKCVQLFSQSKTISPYGTTFVFHACIWNDIDSDFSLNKQKSHRFINIGGIICSGTETLHKYSVEGRL